jgi:hypothetical protein
MQIGLGGLVFIVFLYLKLHGDIDWSWIWVTSPLWIAGALTVLTLIGLAVVAVRADAKADKGRQALRSELNRRHARTPRYEGRWR